VCEGGPSLPPDIHNQKPIRPSVRLSASQPASQPPLTSHHITSRQSGHGTPQQAMATNHKPESLIHRHPQHNDGRHSATHSRHRIAPHRPTSLSLRPQPAGRQAGRQASHPSVHPSIHQHTLFQSVTQHTLFQSVTRQVRSLRVGVGVGEVAGGLSVSQSVREWVCGCGAPRRKRLAHSQ